MTTAEIILLVLESFALVAGIVVAIAALLAARYARRAASSAEKGLSTWKEQLKGKNEYDLARRLLLSIYKYQDAIHRYHDAAQKYNFPMYKYFHPFRYAFLGFLGDVEEKSLYNKNQTEMEDECFKRLNRVLEIQKDIKVLLLETKVFWDKNTKIKKIIDDMFELQSSLRLPSQRFSLAYYNVKKVKDFDKLVKKAENCLQEKLGQ